MNRIDYYKVAPSLIGGIGKAIAEAPFTALDHKLKALVELRASQINGCAYCVDLHSQQARKAGEDQQRLDALPVWRESSFFTPAERAALEWTESLTKVSETHAEDAEYEALAAHFSELEIVELSAAVALINFWNRMAVGFRKAVPRRNP